MYVHLSRWSSNCACPSSVVLFLCPLGAVHSRLCCVYLLAIMCGCSVASSRQPGCPRSDLHSNNPHHPDCC